MSPSKETASEKGKVLPCCSKVRLKRGPWTPEEDAVLTSFVRREGEGKWRTLPRRAGLLRCGKSCRLRWMNYLRPSVKRGQIAPDEEDLILRLHRLLGNRWSLIAGRIPGRTDNEIKNYWNTHLSKRLISQGIDPRTHKPLKTDIPCASIQTDRAPAPTAPAANPNPTHQSELSVRKHNAGQEDVGRLLDSSGRDQSQPWNNLDSSYSGRALPDQNLKNDFAYCSDELFASFLDCLVNNDLFQHNPQINIYSTPDPLASQSFGVETQLFWEPTSVVYSTALQDTNHNPQWTEEEEKNPI